MFLSLDGTFWVQIVNFFVFYAILSIVYIRPAAEALRKRRAYIDSVQSEYEGAIREARELKGQAQAVRAEARREAEQRAVAVRAEAQRAADKLIVEAQSRAAAIVAEAHSTVEGELQTARANEDALVNDLAYNMLARAVGSA